MCGIFAYVGKTHSHQDLQKSFMKLQGRGPDHCAFISPTPTLLFGFHRLKIVDLTEEGNQPCQYQATPSSPLSWSICNGEIYNYRILSTQYHLKQKGSDCHILLPLYHHLMDDVSDSRQELENFFSLLDGVFALVLFDGKNVVVGRDPFGVRPLFWGKNIQGEHFFASEMKALVSVCTHIEPFRPGTWWSSQEPFYHPYYHYSYSPLPQWSSLSKNNIPNDVFTSIRHFLTRAVSKRLMSDRPLGCLLSGGLDSSLITSIVVRELRRTHPEAVVETFSIGLPGSPDLDYADTVAQFLGTRHHRVEVSEQDFFQAIPEVIYAMESYDTTTIRASVGNYLIGKYIKQHTDCTVIFNGDGSDEQSGYLYLQNAPSDKDFQDECVQLLKDIYLFDVLRSDRSLSSQWSLETRTPFLDQDFVRFYMSLPPSWKTYSRERIEKYLLRQSFDVSVVGIENAYLPSEVLWRKKEAFSDGCSHHKRSWHEIVEEYVDRKVSDHEFQSFSYTHNPPLLKESFYYRRIFSDYFPQHDNVIPYFWMPKWCGPQIDPSARVLFYYQVEENNVPTTETNKKYNLRKE